MSDASDVRLVTERFVLRAFHPDDASALVELDSDPEIRRYTGGGPAPSEDEIRSGPLARILAWNDRNPDLGCWWIHDRGDGDRPTGTPLGWVHLRPLAWADDPHSADPRQPLELGWRLHRRAWGRGAATEATAAIATDAIRRLGATRLVAVAMPDNDASFRVMERLGLRFAGVRVLHGGLRCIEYGVDAADWRSDATPPARVHVRDMTDDDAAAVRVVLADAFGSSAEADLVDRLRSDAAPIATLVAEPRGGSGICGVVVISPARKPFGTACLGPVAVVEDHRRRGVGSRLVRASLARAAESGWTASAVLGDPAGYHRYGYESATPLGFSCRWTDGEAFMVRALEGGRLPEPGVIEWDEAFDVVAD